MANYVLVYNNPERNYVWAFGFDTYEEALDKLADMTKHGYDSNHFLIVQHRELGEIVKELA